MKTTLARIARLEAQNRPLSAPRLTILVCEGDEQPIGASGGLGGQSVDRQSREPLLAFWERAGRELGARLLCAIYPPEHALAAPELAAPISRPETTATDPDLAGVGEIDWRYIGWHPANVGMS